MRQWHGFDGRGRRDFAYERADRGRQRRRARRRLNDELDVAREARGRAWNAVVLRLRLTVIPVFQHVRYDADDFVDPLRRCRRRRPCPLIADGIRRQAQPGKFLIHDPRPDVADDIRLGK